jgi:hypothetical protein
MDFRQISEFTFGPKNVRGMPGYITSFTVYNSEDILLDIGQDDRWTNAFLGETKNRINQSRFR